MYDNIIDSNYTSNVGGGIYCEDRSNIKHNRFMGNSAYEGGGIAVIEEDGLAIVDSNTIISNSAAYVGGGVYCGRFSHPRVSWNEIRENRAPDGAGIFCDYTFAKITHNNITENDTDLLMGAAVGNSAFFDTLSYNTISDNNWGSGIGCYRGNSVLEYNTITGNWACGIYAADSSITVIRGNVIQDHNSGGIRCAGRRATLYGNIVGNNRGNYGGGLYATNIISANNNIFYGNFATHGGGIYLDTCQAVLTNNVSYGNSAVYTAGLYSHNSDVSLTNSVIWGDTSDNGGEIFYDGIAPTIIYSDIDGGWEGPGNFDANPLFRNPRQGDFHLMSILCGDAHNSPCIDVGGPSQVDSLEDCSWGLGERYCDIGAYGGGVRQGGIINVPDEMVTIQAAIHASQINDTVLIQPGVYTENLNFEGKSVTVGSLFITTGDTSYISRTVLDGGNHRSTIEFYHGEGSTSIVIGLTITGGRSNYGGGIYCSYSSPAIIHNIIRDNTALEEGGGIYCTDSSPKIAYNIVKDNRALGYFDCGGGIYCEDSQALIENNIIIGNFSATTGGGLSLWWSNSNIVNNVISGNTARSGAGIFTLGNSIIVNNIIWADTATEDSTEVFVEYGNPTIQFCDIEGGWPGNGNVNTDPLFRNPEGDDFSLMAAACGYPVDSPCIDMGDPEISDRIINCSHGLGQERSDIGAFGGDSFEFQTDIADESPYYGDLPKDIELLQNYPNPFNAQTEIQYVLSSTCHVRIEIYDLLGRRVGIIADESQQSGLHRIIWNAESRSSGLYFCNIVAGGSVQAKKMLLLR